MNINHPKLIYKLSLTHHGKISKGQKIKFLATQKEYSADEVGTLNLTQTPKKFIGARF